MVSVRAAKVKKLLTLFLSPLEFFSGIRGEWPAEWKLGAPPEVGPIPYSPSRGSCAGLGGGTQETVGRKCRMMRGRAREGPHGRADDTDFRVRQRGRRRPWQGPVARTPSGPERERRPAIETR